MKTTRMLLLMIAMAGALVACDRDDHDHEPAAPASEPAASSLATNRLDIPPAVRQNLGITFARAQYRRVASTLRMPGRFELLPTARHEYRAPFAGRVDLLVRQYDTVEPGQMIARIHSPAWHRLQLELEEDAADIDRAEAELKITRQALLEAQANLRLLDERLARLQSAEVRRVELENEAAGARQALPRLQAEVDAKQAALDSARHHLPLAEAAAAAQLGLTREQLLEPVTTPAGSEPRWRAMAVVEVRAADPGVVETILVTDGGRVDELGGILTTIDPRQVRFRAVGLQSDMIRLRDGLSATIIAPADRGEAQLPPVTGKLHIAAVADPDERTIDLLVVPVKLEPWCRPGIAAVLEIDTAVANEELAIPRAAVIQDGLKHVFYRRDPRHPDVAVRVDADLGISDGRWIVVQSGLAEDDEVVLEGIYELKLASAASGSATGGGHFHADGAWHPDGEAESGGEH